LSNLLEAWESPYGVSGHKKTETRAAAWL